MQTKPTRSTALILAASLALGSALLSGNAFSHGNPHKKTAVVKKEQTEWGIAGEPKQIQRTIKITMADTMRFTPEKLEVKQGETVKIVMQNQGRILHEFVIGTPKELEQHAALMIKFPNMEHDEPYMAHVPPSKSGSITWTFNRAGEFDFACLIAGHYSSGMKGKIMVSAQ